MPLKRDASLVARCAALMLAMAGALGVAACQSPSHPASPTGGLQERGFFDERVTVLVPDGFVPDDSPRSALQAGSHGPESHSFRSADGSAGMSVGRQISKADPTGRRLDAPKARLLAMVFDGIKNDPPPESILRDEIVDRGGHAFRVLELASFPPAGLHVWMTGTASKSEMFIVSFATSADAGAEWDAIAARVIDSMSLTEKEASRDVGPLVRDHVLPERPTPVLPGYVVVMSCELDQSALAERWPHLATWNAFGVDVDSVGDHVVLDLVDARAQRTIASAQLPVVSHPTRYVIAMTAVAGEATSSARVEVYSATDPGVGIVCSVDAPLPAGSPAGPALDAWNFSSSGGAFEVSQGPSALGALSWNGPGSADLVAARDSNTSPFVVDAVAGMDESLVGKTTDRWPGDAYVLRIDAP